MLLLTWNLNARISKIREQVAAIARYNPDIIALQEVTINSSRGLKEGLMKSGYQYVEDSFSLSGEAEKLNGKRKYGQVIASRFKLKCRDPEEFDVPWKERILSVDVITDTGKIELHNTHIPPGSSNGWIKIEMLEGIYNRLNRNTKKLRILCGDFNTPKLEKRDGTIISCAFHIRKSENGEIKCSLKKSRGTRWDIGERNILCTLKNKNLHDVFRKINGYDVEEFTWHVNHGSKTGRRFDHIFASEELNPVKCFYDHSVRVNGLSDHSMMLAEFGMDS